MRSFFAVLVLMASVVAIPVVRGQEQATPTGLAGKWHFVLDTQGGDRELDANFTVADGKVGGTFGKGEAKGTVNGEKFSLEFPFDSDEVGKGTMKVDGKLATDQLTGSWSFQTYDGSFKATRPKVN